MKIAMLGQKGIPARSGGVEQAVDSISEHLIGRGHEVTVYCRRSYLGRGARASSEAGLHRVFLPSIPTKHLDAISHTVVGTANAIWRRPEVAHYHAIGPAALAPFARIARLPVVVTCHGLDWQRAKWGWLARQCLKISERVASFAASKLIVVSPVLRDYYAREFGVEAEFIPNGIMPIERRPPRRMLEFGIRPGEYALAVARLVPEKGLHHLLEAFRTLPGETQLVIAGDGGLDLSYEKRLRENLDPRVIFTGGVDRGMLAELYSHARLFVLPSDLEGMSLALLEAMSMDLPVLVSDIPENASVVGDAGFYFRRGDAEDLRAQLALAHSDPRRARSLGLAAGQRVAPYRWSRVVDQLEQVYEECLARKNHSLVKQRA